MLNSPRAFTHTYCIARPTLGAVLVIFGLLFPNLTFAQSTVGLTITPPMTEEQLEPGAEFSYVLKIENRGDAAEVLFPTAYNISGISQTGEPQFVSEGGETEYELAGWMTFDQKELHVPPRGNVSLGVTVRVPKVVSPGLHIGSVGFVRQAPTERLVGSSVGYEVRSILSLRIAGDIVERTQIREFFAGRIFFTKPEVRFVTSIENAGNVFARPKGFIDIVNMWGTKVDTLPVNDGGASVFPKSTRDFTNEWKSDGFHIGKYTADITLTVEGSKGFQSLLSSVEFWVIPTNVVFPVLGGLLVVVVFFWIILRVYVRRQIARAVGGRVAARRAEARSLSRLSAIVIALLVAMIIGLLVLLFFIG